MSILQANSSNCFKQKIPLLMRDFLFGNICFFNSNLNYNWLCISGLLRVCCFQYAKDTKKKANHNNTGYGIFRMCAVSNTPKILKRKQITPYLLMQGQVKKLFPIRQRY